MHIALIMNMSKNSTLDDENPPSTQKEGGVSRITKKGSKNEPKKKPAANDDNIMKCPNGCGYMTRYPREQALKVKKRDKNNIIVGEAKYAEKPYMCPNCDRNGCSGKLVHYP